MTSTPSVRRGQLSAAEAAHCLTGVMSWIQRRTSVNRMQEIAAELARFDAAWSSSFGALPSSNGWIDEHMALLATVCRGLIEMAGAVNLRAALSFWATESDPAVWRQLFA
jgi:hypothetical protein